jgi:hypothetical protein
MEENTKSMAFLIHYINMISKSVLKLFKRFYPIFLVIAIAFLISIFPVKSSYFKSDVTVFQQSVEQYNTTFTLIFLIVAIIVIVVYLFSGKFKQKTKIGKEDFFIKSFFFTFVMSLLIISNFHLTITNIALNINMIKAEYSIDRIYTFGHYNSEKNELAILDNAFECVEMDFDTYSNIKNDTVVKLKFDVGILDIPFNPRFVPLSMK